MPPSVGLDGGCWTHFVFGLSVYVYVCMYMSMCPGGAIHQPACHQFLINLLMVISWAENLDVLTKLFYVTQLCTSDNLTIGVLDGESRVISIHKVNEWWAAWPHSHVVQYPVYCNIEKCWGKDAALTDTWCRFEACRFVFPDTNCCSSIFMKGSD